MKRVDALTSGDKNMVTSDAVYNAIANETIKKIWGTLVDNETQDVLLTPNKTYLYFNTHVYNVEMVLFTVFNGNVQTLCRLTSYHITDFMAVDTYTVRLSATGACRGYIFQLGDTNGV